MSRDDPAAGGAPPPDPALVIPELPPLDREVGSFDFPLRRTADGGSVSLLTPAGLQIEGAVVEQAVETPIGVLRRLRVRGEVVEERHVMAPAAPVAFREWSARADLRVVVRWPAPSPASAGGVASDAAAHRGPPRWRAEGRGLVLAIGRAEGVGQAESDPLWLYVFSDPPERVEPRPGSDGRWWLRAELGLRAGGSVRMAAAPLPAAEDRQRVLRVMGRPHVVVPARRAAVTRILEERLSLEAPGSGMGDALAWAVLRLAAPDGPQERGASVSGSEPRRAIASLAIGDPAPARALLLGVDRWDAAHLLLVARYMAWTGDLRTVRGAWSSIRAAIEALLENGGEPGEAEARSLSELRVVAEEVGDGELAKRLHQPVPSGPPGAGYAGGDAPERAPAEPLLPAGGSAAVAVVEAMVQGLLGAEPDAPRGRLVLRPRLPGSWARLAVRSLPLGPARVELEYERAEGRHRFALRQARGGPPVTIILEPELEGERVIAARVDGAEAELDAHPAQGRVRVPVQLVLDAERRLEVEIGGGDG